MKKWECSVCGYIHEGEEPPLQCPVCKADREKFFEVKSSDEIVRQVEQETDLAEIPVVESYAKNQLTILEKVTGLILEKHLHPISVHSPNGIIPVAVIFLILDVVLHFSGLGNAAYYNMIAVLFSMPLVIVSGYVTWQKKYMGVKTSVFKIKIAASCVATSVLFGLVVWKKIQPDVLLTASSDRWLFLVWSLILLAAVGLAGHLGGQLVFAKKNNK